MKMNNDSIFTDCLSATSGTINYTLTNDYMFHSVMQSNENILKGLLCSLLHLNPAEVVSTEVLNPIELGKTIDEKDFQLDIKIRMNNRVDINLEMQLRNEHNWPERSLIYLCRLFDDLNKGKDYAEIKPAFQISILDFTLFAEFPEFYATYFIMNEKNHHKYSDKFTMHMLDLTQSGLATKEDKDYKLDQWARLFKTKTWEDFKMIAADDKVFQELGETLFKLNADKKIRYQCEAREEYWRIQNTRKWEMETQKATIAEQDATIAEQDATIAEQDATIVKQETTIAKQETTIAKQETTIAKQETTIAKQETTIAEQKAVLAEKDSVIAKLEATIAMMNAEKLKK